MEVIYEYSNLKRTLKAIDFSVQIPGRSKILEQGVELYFIFRWKFVTFTNHTF